jgi:predicted ATPase/DNA-binding CsgD family transcriptional regulator
VLSKRLPPVPSLPTPFFGRQTEIAELAARLTDPACRLVTLTGAGGIGKTRLALRAAVDVQARFAQGVWFVPLQPVSSADLLATAVADVLGLPLSAPADPQTQLYNYLSDKNVLLILDNFEHLLRASGAEFLPGLLEAAPALKLLVTSREALQLQTEWLYPLSGLPVPPNHPAEAAARYDLVQLFVERARRVRKDFSLAAELAGVVRICQLVEGVPLAAELAAAWTNVLGCDAIAMELGDGLRFLQTSLRDVPDRHRSLRAVFDESWKLLSPDERGVFQRLPVFRGGFQRAAAEQAAGATLPILAALARQSLLYLTPDGRYQIHELLRQYAAERLAQASPEGVAEARERHGVYYTTFLRDRNADMNNGEQLRAVAEIAAELDNLRAAWQWAVERRNIAALAGGANALFLFCQFRSHYQEGAQLFGQAVSSLDDAAFATHPGAPLLLYELGWLCIRLGRLAEAQAHFERCQAVSHPLREPPEHAHASDPRLGLGLLASLRGDYPAARRLLDDARQVSARNHDLGNQQVADYFLAGIHLAQGEYEAAQSCAQAAYAVAEASQDRWFMAFCLNELGSAARALGALEQARRHYQASYTLREEFGDPGGMAVALSHLGTVAILQGDMQTAEDRFRQSLALYRDINDQGGLIAALDGLGQVCCARGQFQPAAQHFSAALHLTGAGRFIALRLALLVSVGQLLLQTGHPLRALEVLACVRQHAATVREAQQRVQRLLERYPALQRPLAPGSDLPDDLEALTARVQFDLAAMVGQPDPGRGPSAPPALIEPLTPRERELLQLLAAGLPYEAIAVQLTIAVGSVKSHAHHIYGKLGVRNRVQAAARAVELGLL